MIRVLIVDDMKLLRECLRLAIEQEDEFEVVGCAGDGREAVEMALRYNPDIILMDLNMPVYSGYEAIKDIKSLRNHIKILVLTVEGDKKNIAQAFLNGADGYVMKDICTEALSAAISNTYQGVPCIQDSAFNLCGGEVASAEPRQYGSLDLKVNFTVREKEVLELVLEGLTNEQISDVLGISVGRARNIVTELISKCMVKNRTQLAVMAVTMKMLMLI